MTKIQNPKPDVQSDVPYCILTDNQTFLNDTVYTP